MNKFEKYIFKWIVRRWMTRGGHGVRIIAMYWMIRNAFEEEFTEDDYYTADEYLADCFSETQRTDKYKLINFGQQ